MARRPVGAVEGELDVRDVVARRRERLARPTAIVPAIDRGADDVRELRPVVDDGVAGEERGHRARARSGRSAGSRRGSALDLPPVDSSADAARPGSARPGRPDGARRGPRAPRSCRRGVFGTPSIDDRQSKQTPIRRRRPRGSPPRRSRGSRPRPAGQSTAATRLALVRPRPARRRARIDTRGPRSSSGGERQPRRAGITALPRGARRAACVPTRSVIPPRAPPGSTRPLALVGAPGRRPDVGVVERGVGELVHDLVVRRRADELGILERLAGRPGRARRSSSRCPPSTTSRPPRA